MTTSTHEKGHRSKLAATATATPAAITVSPIEKGRISPVTQKQYRWQLEAFKKYLGLASKGDKNDDELYTRLSSQSHIAVERKIIEYLDDYLTKTNHLNFASVNTAKAAILRFCIMNDILLNREKIGMSLSADADGGGRRAKPDYAYTRQEITDLIDSVPDLRDRVIIYLMASSGMRVGSIPNLEFQDLTEILLPPDNIQKVYQINVYARSGPRHEYYTFVTPECHDSIQKYLKFRRDKSEFGDDNKQEVNEIIANNPTSPLIRERFNITSRVAAKDSDKVSLSSIQRVIERAVYKAGIFITKPEHRVQTNNGFRKFAMSAMIEAEVDYDVREYLIGHRHSRGLSGVHYDRTHRDVRLKKWSAAINSLTINDSFYLKKEVQLLKNEYEKKIQHQSHTITEQSRRIAIANRKIERFGKELLDLQDRRVEDYIQINKNFVNVIKDYVIKTGTPYIDANGNSYELDKEGNVVRVLE